MDWGKAEAKWDEGRERGKGDLLHDQQLCDSDLGGQRRKIKACALLMLKGSNLM